MTWGELGPWKVVRRRASTIMTATLPCERKALEEVDRFPAVPISRACYGSGTGRGGAPLGEAWSGKPDALTDHGVDVVVLPSSHPPSIAPSYEPFTMETRCEAGVGGVPSPVQSGSYADRGHGDGTDGGGLWNVMRGGMGKCRARNPVGAVGPRELQREREGKEAASAASASRPFRLLVLLPPSIKRLASTSRPRPCRRIQAAPSLLSSALDPACTLVLELPTRHPVPPTSGRHAARPRQPAQVVCTPEEQEREAYRPRLTPGVCVCVRGLGSRRTPTGCSRP